MVLFPPLRKIYCSRDLWQVPGPTAISILLRAYDDKVVHFAPTNMQRSWTVMYSTLCTLQSSQAERHAAENKDTTAQRANSSTVVGSMAQGSGKHLLIC